MPTPRAQVADAHVRAHPQPEHARQRTLPRPTLAPSWAVRGGVESEVLSRLAVLHIGLGVFGVLAGMVLWYAAAGLGDGSIFGSGIALGLTVCASAALTYYRLDFPLAATCARATLIGGDVLAGMAAVWLALTLPTGTALAMPSPFLSPVLITLLLLGPLSASILFSPRVGAAVLSGELVLLALMGALWVGSVLGAPTIGGRGSTQAQVPWGWFSFEAAALILIGGSTLWCWSSVLDAGRRVLAVQQRERDRAEARAQTLASEQEALSFALGLVEQDLAHAERERAGLIRQTQRIADLAQDLAHGQANAAYQLDLAAHGPLASLAAALRMLARRTTFTSHGHAQVCNSLAEKLSLALQEQREAMSTLERAVRQSSRDAEAIAAAFPHGRSPFASSVPSAQNEWAMSSPQFAADVAALAETHAQRTAQYLARMAQLQAHHAECEQTAAHLVRLLTAGPEVAVDECETPTLLSRPVRRTVGTQWSRSSVTTLRHVALSAIDRPSPAR